MPQYSTGNLTRIGLTLFMIGSSGFALPACNTFHGAGKDASNAGTATENATHTAVRATSKAASNAASATGNAADNAGNAVAKTYNNTVN
jgi:predicted small secreted protein